ncbi:gluconokinase [Vagococcus vulneris]|uniref:Gluconokinase n=1 Tax=Vagococcus vulneris TaxID=1977869 RepID=A0A430A195_9ENTE|nr:gluconokinase [Vagococcus vulneris]RSU00166.1 hypothetical protein CBF37_02390 [Vagococcus vulneris]
MSILAIDVGTTNLKCQIFENHQIVDMVSVPIETHSDNTGKVYQNPERILIQIKRTVRVLTQKGYDITSIIFCTAMHSIMPSFESGIDQELLIWQDSQSSEFVKEFRQDSLAHEFYGKTGTPIHEMSPFSKIAHFRNKGWFASVDKWIGLKEYLMQAFTGHLVVDYSVASATGMFNLKEKRWDEDVLTFLNIESTQLASLVDTDQYYIIKESLADELFISRDVKVYVGASDGCLASYASYVSNGTSNTLTVGTSGAIRKLSKEIKLDSKGQTFCYYLTKDYWVVGGATNNGGQVLEWADKIFYDNNSLYEKLADIVYTSPIGSRGISFLPFLSGERAPLWDSSAMASFQGVKKYHSKEDLTRAIVEGVLFNLFYIAELIDLDIRDLSINGGFFQNDVLAIMTADIFGKTCIQSEYSEAAFGAVSLIEPPTANQMTEQKRIFYNEDNHKRYMQYYDVYKKRLAEF